MFFVNFKGPDTGTNKSMGRKKKELSELCQILQELYHRPRLGRTLSSFSGTPKESFQIVCGSTQ